MFSTNNILKYLINGDQLAFKWVYDQYSPSLYQLVFNILKDKEHTDEVIQDSFLQLWNNRLKLLSDSNIKVYLFVLCRNNSFNRLKILNRERSRFVDLSKVDIENINFAEVDKLTEREVKETLEYLINKLPARQREVFRLSRIDGLSYYEIAEKLHISKNTVKNHLIAALKAMKEDLKKAQQNSTLYMLIYFYFFG